jgi:aminoglycoside 3-N-acetyltransferase
VTSGDICDGLRELGIRPGAVVLAHGSLGRLGWVHGGEEAVIDALLSAVGSEGTVCMPTVSYGRYGPRHPPPPFDPARTAGMAGRISERFRQRDGVIRSLHPTHSVAASGPLAAT